MLNSRPYLIFFNVYFFFKHCPNDAFVAPRGGETTIISEESSISDVTHEILRVNMDFYFAAGSYEFKYKIHVSQNKSAQHDTYFHHTVKTFV